jgi:Arc/MetJ-type ribon-helix-helix transcriptional regulator
MAAIQLPEEIQSVVDAEVRERGFSSASDYLATLVRQDQQRRTDEALDAIAEQGWESGEPVEMTADSWRELRLELHRQAGID